MYSQGVRDLSPRSSRSIVLHYRLSSSKLSSLRKAAGNGLDVACLTADAAIEQQRPSGIYVLGADALPVYLDVIETGALLGLVEIVFDFLGQRSRVLPWLRSLYGSSDIDYYFRRALLNDLLKLFSVVSLTSQPPLAGFGEIVLTADWPSSRLWPFFMDLWRTDSGRARLAGHVPHIMHAGLDRLTVGGQPRGSTRDVTRRSVRALYHLVRTWYLTLRRLRLCPARLPIVKLLLRSYASDTSINLGGQDKLRNIDFIVDGDELPAEDVAFWVEPGVSVERRQALQQRGYRLLTSDDVVIGPAAFARRELPLLASYTTLLPRLVQEDQWWYPHIASLVNCYLIWREVCRQVQPEAFVAYNDLSAIGVGRNIVLRQKGCRSVFYQHSCSMPIAENGAWALNVVYPYLVFDAIADWGPDHSDLFRRHPGAIGDYWEVGCLWAEHARLVRENPKLRKNYADQIESYTGLKLSAFVRVVGVFDTSVSSMLSCDDMYSFLVGNLELARKMPRVLFLYKPKLPFAKAEPGWPTIIPLIEAFGSKGRELYKNICATANFVALPRLFETASVVELADLVISACFTSVTVEAIGCGRRAIFYGPTDHLPHAFWRRIPGMVCVTDDELYDRVRYLLWDCDGETYKAYLRTYFMGIEGHFDGLAITRLRRRLLEVMDGRRYTKVSHGG